MHNEGGWARSIEVIPGLNDASRPYSSAVGTQFRSVTGWTQSKKRENDYGAIILPANARLGDTTGTFGFAIRNDGFLTSAKLNLSGYPGDKGGNQQWFMAQKGKSVTSRVITYDIDTVGGQSGSPVWVLQDGNRYAVGIHTNGSASGNSATRIESSVYERITEWRGLGA
jgi:V8-like Glu-specific endopeptidase